MEKQFDRDLAIAVFQRWSVGEPVSEVSLVKAASALGTNPYDALLEARYYTDLTNYLNRGGGEMNDYEKHIFSGATGFHSDDMCKTASAYMLPDEELILAHLAEQNFVPYLPKLAEAMAQAGTDPNAQQGQQVQQDPELEAQMQELMAQQQMAQQQQVQAGMVKPTPTAPSQIPPSPSGNSEQLLYNEVNKDQLEQQRQQQVQQQQMQQTQQNPQQGSKEQLQQMYSAMTPEQKIQHAAPQVGMEHRQRYADTLGQVEQTAGLKITDPSQVQKVVKGVEKQDKKIIDEAIKQVTDVQAGAGGAGGGANFGPLPGEPGDTSGQGAPGGPSPGGAAGGVDPTAGSAPPEGGAPGPQEGMPPGQGKPPQKPKTPPGAGGGNMDKMAYLNELRARSFLEKLAISRELKNKVYAEHTARDTAAAFKGDLNSSVGFPSRRDNPLNKHIGLGGGYLERREVKDPIYNRIRPEAGDRETVMANSRARAKQLTNNYSRDLTGLEMANNLNQGGLQNHLDTLKASKANQIMANQYSAMPQGAISQYPTQLGAQPLTERTLPGTGSALAPGGNNVVAGRPGGQLSQYNVNHGNAFTGLSGHGVAFDNSIVGPQGGFTVPQQKINTGALDSVEGMQTGKQRRLAKTPPATSAAPVAEAASVASHAPTSAIPKKSFFKGKGKMLGLGALGAAGLAGAGYMYKKHKEKTASEILDELRAQTFLMLEKDAGILDNAKNFVKKKVDDAKSYYDREVLKGGRPMPPKAETPKHEAPRTEAPKVETSKPHTSVPSTTPHIQHTPAVPPKGAASPARMSRGKKALIGAGAVGVLGAGARYAHGKYKDKTASYHQAFLNELRANTLLI